jgi:hypothetical protein
VPVSLAQVESMLDAMTAGTLGYALMNARRLAYQPHPSR